jgi:O-antigen/teichoic acid export membrane protein
MTLRPSEFSVKFFGKSLRFGCQICLSSLAGFLIYRIDLAILAYMVSAEDLGLYLIAVALAEKLKLLPKSISGAFLPRLANELSDRQTQVPMVFRYTTIVSIVSMLAVGLIGVPAIIILFGKAYTGSILSFLFLLPGVACLGGATVLSSDSLTRNKPKYSVWIGYTMLAGNVVLNLIFIPKIGIAGAAIASSITYAGSAVMWMFCYKYESKVAIKELFPQWQDVRFLLKMSWLMISGTATMTMIRLRMTREVGISKDKPMI